MDSWSTPDETLAYLKHVFPGVDEVSGQKSPGLLPLPGRKLAVKILECAGLRDEQTGESGTVYAVLRINNGPKACTSRKPRSHTLYWGQDFVFNVDEAAARILHVEVRRERADGSSGPAKTVHSVVRRVLARTSWKRDQVLGRLTICLTGIPRHGIEGWYEFQDDEGQSLPMKLKVGLCFLTQVPVVFSSGNPNSDHYNLAYAFFTRSIAEFEDRAVRSKSWKECIPKPAATLLHQNAVQRGLTKIDRYSCYLKVIAAVRDLGLGRVNCMVVYNLLENLLAELKKNASFRRSMERLLLETLHQTDDILTNLHGDFDQTDEFEAIDLQAGLCCRGLLKHLYVDVAAQ